MSDLRVRAGQTVTLPKETSEAPKEAVKELTVPLGQSPQLPRSNTGPSKDHDSSVNAVLLGLAAFPAALVALGVSSPAAAQTTVADQEGVNLAHDMLFASNQSTEDPHVRELTTKIGRLVDRSFHGDTRAAFDHYAGADGKVDRGELSTLLSDAGIGNFITRGAWVSGIMDKVDGAPNGNGDGKISWTEFNRIVSTSNVA